MPGLKERAKTLVELADGAYFLFAQAAAGARRQGAEAADAGGAGDPASGFWQVFQEVAWEAQALDAAARILQSTTA